LHRVYHLWDVTRSFGLHEITTAWAAHTLVRIDGGPMLDYGQLAPALRALGYTPVRRRQSSRRVNAWLLPGLPPSRRGRPPGDVPRGDPSVWPLFWGSVVPFRNRGNFAIDIIQAGADKNKTCINGCRSNSKING